jgi:hypothetical protein
MEPSGPVQGLLCFSGIRFLISSFRRVLYVVCFLLGNYTASGVQMPTFRNTLFHLHSQVDASRMN